MDAIERAVSWAIDVANSNKSGYSQTNRWGNPDYDCSSFIISAWEQAGICVKTKGATYTGNMYFTFISCGFEDVTNKINLASGCGLQRGDVLLNTANHTAMCINETQVVHARSCEGNPMGGDQSGNEIRVQKYWNYPWNYVLRLKNNTNSVNCDTAIKDKECNRKKFAIELNEIQKGDTGEFVKSAQILLIGNKCSVGPDGADGEFGNNSELGTKVFQSKKGLTPTGKIDEITWKKLLGVN